MEAAKIMIYIRIFWAFFISGILSYGGGPSVIPLIKEQVVDRYHWMNNHDFSEMIAAANALPGPIATKMAGYIGYDVAGWQGATVALFAAIAPTLLMMIALLGILMKYKNSVYVKNLTAYIRPIIGVLFVLITVEFVMDAIKASNILFTVMLMVISFVLLQKMKWHPAIVIGVAMGLGALRIYFI